MRNLQAPLGSNGKKVARKHQRRQTIQGLEKQTMGMRIKSNVTSIKSQRQLGVNNRALNKSMEKLASGERINSSADDAAGMAISEKLRGNIRGLNQSKRNAMDAKSMVETAEGAMQEMSNILIRMREITIQSASDTLGEQERGYLNREYVQLADEIDRIADTTEFNGRKFFEEESQEAGQYIIQVGIHGTDPEDNLDTLTINLDGLRFSTSDFEIGKDAEIGPGIGEESGPSRQEIAAKLDPIDTALNRIASERATLGAINNRLTSTVNNLEVSVEAKETARSLIRDVDFAHESSEMAKSKILAQSGISVLSQANSNPEMALQLLR